MHIQIHKLRWKNFISSGQQWIELQLDTHMTSLVVGDNGAGKSTILDALSFVLYGKPFRRVLKGQLLNTINNKDCVVEITFSIGSTLYFVRRGIKPNIFEVFRDGELLNQDAEVKEYQEHFEKHIFTIPFSAFPQVVALGSASFVPFMQLEKKDRSKMIEGLLGTEIFTVMATLLKDKVSKNKTKIVESDAFVLSALRAIETAKRRNEELAKTNDDVIAEKRQKIATLDEQIFEVDIQARASASEALVLREQLQALPRAQKKYAEVGNLLALLVAKKSALEILHESDTCPTCKQGILHDMKASNASRLEEFAKGIVDLEQQSQALHDEIKQLERTKEWAQKFESSERELNGRLTVLNSLKGDIEADIVKIQRVTEKQQGEGGDLATAEREYAEYQTEREKLVRERSMLETANVLLKDTGIKSRVVKLYIPIINKLVNKYLAAMDFFVNFELDENFQEKVKSRFRDEFSYDSFSEGEKDRLDVALLFTWRAIAKMRNSASTNLLILDEVFDGSLDAQGNEELLKILHTLSDCNVFVISHKTDAFVDKFQRVIRFEKHKNFSRIVEAL